MGSSHVYIETYPPLSLSKLSALCLSPRSLSLSRSQLSLSLASLSARLALSSLSALSARLALSSLSLASLSLSLASLSALSLSRLALGSLSLASLSALSLSRLALALALSSLSLASLSLSRSQLSLSLALSSLSLSPISLRQTLSPSSAIAAAISLSLSARSVSRDFIFSFEFLTPRPKEDIEKLMSTIDGMVNHGPSFCDLTWRPGGLETDLTLKVAGKMQNEVGVETLLHLAVTSMTMEMIDHALDTAKAKGTNNILALKGDPVKGKDPAQDPLQCALYLVKYIRAKHGDYFGIAVAGYPG
ncbi:hypothetical protein AAC387_Pa09g1489 [Persea americana]